LLGDGPNVRLGWLNLILIGLMVSMSCGGSYRLNEKLGDVERAAAQRVRREEIRFSGT